MHAMQPLSPPMGLRRRWRQRMATEPPPDEVVFQASGGDADSGRRLHVACLYHLLSKAVTPDGAKQGQFVQDDPAATARRGTNRCGAELDVVELPRLTRMMSERTPYVPQFNASRNADTPVVMLYPQNPTVVTVNGNDARAYSAPSAFDVAVLVVGD